jgi:biopolymer transport protein ExbB/TolQ
MDNVMLSILLVLIGLFVGIILMFIFNYIKNLNLSKKAENIIEKAKKEADKIKRDLSFRS